MLPDYTFKVRGVLFENTVAVSDIQWWNEYKENKRPESLF